MLRLTVFRLNLDQAKELLGVPEGSPSSAVRAAFRSRIVELHPDHAGAAFTDDTVQLLEAYRLVLAETPAAVAVGPDAPVAEQAPPEDPTRTEQPTVWLVDRDTIALECTHEEAFVRMIEVGHQLGAITYLDRQGELLEVLLTTLAGDSLSLVISFQGRVDRVEAFITVEPLDRPRGDVPTVEDLTELVAYRLQHLL
jgi:hypothetical protein